MKGNNLGWAFCLKRNKGKEGRKEERKEGWRKFGRGGEEREGKAESPNSRLRICLILAQTPASIKPPQQWTSSVN